MKLIIEDDEGRKTVVAIVREEITIGRQDGNTIKLTERNVSRRHARLVRDNGFLLIEDLGSYNGVRVNGDRIDHPTKIKEGDLIEIGDYDLGIQGKFEAAVPGAAQPRQTIPPGGMTARPGGQRTPAMGVPVVPTPPPQQASTPNASAGGATAIIRVSDLMKSSPEVEQRDLAKTEMPRLVGLSGPVRGKEFYLMRTEVKFGRTEDNDIVLDHQSVSRQHARFVLDGGQWKVIDNKSANGVHVNGELYAVSNVKAGDTLELGHLKFRFCAPGEKFVAPPEKASEETPSKGQRPTTAELIAGASKPGRGSSGPAKKAPVGLIAGIVVAVVAAAVAVVVVKGARKNPEENPKYLTEQGDTALKKHEYVRASDWYDKAAALGSVPPNQKKANTEAKGEETYRSLQSALQGNDADKAKTLFERCGSESSYWCGKAQELGDQVKQKYALKHLGAATAAKSAGKLDQCLAEVNAVLGLDPANAEAQTLVGGCQPQAAPAAEKREGPSAKEREAKAARLAKDAKDKLFGKDYGGAVSRAKAALAESPSDKGTLGTAYMALGYGYAYLGDRDTAKKWLEKYLPFCTTGCDQVKAFLAQ